MFVRKKVNKSGVVSVQIITKVHGKSKLVKSIGSSNDDTVIVGSEKEGLQFIAAYGGHKILDFSDESGLLKSVFQSIITHTEVGTGNLSFQKTTFICG